MKIIGYCTLWAIACALLVAVCVIIKGGHVGSDVDSNGDIVAGKIMDHRTAESGTTPVRPITRVSLPST